MKRMCLGETVPAVEVMSAVCLMHLPQPDSLLQNPAFSPLGEGQCVQRREEQANKPEPSRRKDGWTEGCWLSSLLGPLQPATRDGNLDLKGSSSAARLCSGLFD